uniref:Uncharacterized protein n=1 Tax=Meloidogyne hapla TaxID=6305 RepID=A0A1I8BQ26_MELHA
MDSNELSMANRQNYVVVPSYSEAILLDPYNNVQLSNSERSQFTPSSLLRQLFSSPHRSTGRQQDRQGQYGSIGHRLMLRTAYGEGSPKPLRHKPSRSATIACLNNKSTAHRHLPRPSTLLDRRRMPFPRSITISEGIGYNNVSNEQHNIDECSDRTPLLQRNLTMEMFNTDPPEDGEPPPPYEIALRYCSPIYQRLQQSAHSITSLLSRSRRVSHT